MLNFMPTAAKVVAGLILAVVAAIASEQIKPLLPEGTDFGVFTPLNAVLAFVIGWRFIGNRMQRGYVNAINVGFTAGALLVFWGLFIQSCNEMFALAMKHRYDGPFEAVAAIFEIMIEYGAVMIDQKVLTTLIAGSIFAGIAAEFSANRWR